MKRLTVATAAALLLLAGCGGHQATHPHAATTPTATSTAAPRPASVGRQMPDPQRLSIPALNVTSGLIPLGLNPDGTQQVPPLNTPEQAGWFKPGPEPGEPGASIILGHVNGDGRPGVFAHLDKLVPGDEVFVDGQRFIVSRVIVAPKNQFPAKEVYVFSGPPQLRLITCGGSFDPAARSYTDNVIVEAYLT